ncbi:fimbrial protein [Vibrio galatheae]|uniref:Fimbrial protein n=1 Tax=Vibrio galatheae TaxID=579748 RepID=A0A0F4NII8_9VIBR|nr:type IV pilus secretin PilQ [Vibrio galatheae]KJY82648.1 fimbrial protein [Vibrio galatheae]
MNKGIASVTTLYLGYLLSLLLCLPIAAFAEPQLQNTLLDVDFTLDSKRNGQMVFTLSHPRLATDIQKTEQGISIELIDTQVVDDLLKVFDVSEFSTPVRQVEVFRYPDSVLIGVTIDGEVDFDYRQQGNVLTVVVSSIKATPLKDNGVLGHKSTKLSLNFQDIPVRNVLQLIADYNDFNLVVSDTVSGNLTLRLDDVVWQKALVIILHIKGLDMYVDGNVVLIAPKAELDERLQLGALASEIIMVKFALASDIASLVKGEGAQGLLSSRGTISVDERTNALLIRDLKPNIDAIRSIVESLDVPVKQVQIEARIVTVNEGNLEELGVRWGFSNTNGTTSIGATIEDNLFDSVPIDEMLNVNLAATSTNASTIAFQVAKLGSDMLLDLELSALQRESKAEVISSPRLITTNKKPAYIEQGSEIPYLESSSSGATSVSFKKAVLSLKVTPQITPDNRLILDLNVTQDRPGEVVKTGTGEAVAINTQRIGTQVLVENGETIVLGGIFQHSVTDATEKVPLLGDIPLLGALFRRTYQQMGKSELLIFVTPRVVIERELALERK